jgi:hypothetical protein
VWNNLEHVVFSKDKTLHNIDILYNTFSHRLKDFWMKSKNQNHAIAEECEFEVSIQSNTSKNVVYSQF